MKKAIEILEEEFYTEQLDRIEVVGILKAMREYAAQAITEQLEVAADKAQIKEEKDLESYGGGYYPYVDRESITSCTRIPLP